MLTQGELAILGLTDGEALTSGGQLLEVEVRSGSHTSKSWTDALGSVFRGAWGIELFPGSLNLWADDPIAWEKPACVGGGGKSWDLCPVVLDERAVGVAIRANRERPLYLEVISPVGLRSRLDDLPDGRIIPVRLLPGDVLAAHKNR